MKVWGHLACLVCVGAAVLASSGPALAKPATKQKQGGLVLSSFKLKGTNGYTVEVIGAEGKSLPPVAAVTVQRQSLQASYEVPAEIESGIRAVFGSLGRVAVDFHRHKRTVDRPEKGCAYIKEAGVFSGEFSFLGEGGYTTAETTSVPGEITHLPNGFCGFGNDRRGFPTPDSLRSDLLVARSRVPGGSIEFDASAQNEGSRFQFDASLREARGAMTISRSASASTSAGGLTFGPGKHPRQASVEPPAPFQGSARFRHPTGAPSTWEGSLGVSLPGAPDVVLAGPEFGSRICLGLGIFGGCKLALPPPPS